MARAAWWVLAAIAVAFCIWFGATATTADVSLECSKIAETAEPYECGDRLSTTLGVWPLLGLGLALAVPPVVAALAGRVWVSCVAVLALVAAGIVGLANWTGFWGTLLFAAPLAVLGAIVTAAQQARRRPPRP